MKRGIAILELTLMFLFAECINVLSAEILRHVSSIFCMSYMCFGMMKKCSNYPGDPRYLIFLPNFLLWNVFHHIEIVWTLYQNFFWLVNSTLFCRVFIYFIYTYCMCLWSWNVFCVLVHNNWLWELSEVSLCAQYSYLRWGFSSVCKRHSYSCVSSPSTISTLFSTEAIFIDFLVFVHWPLRLYFSWSWYFVRGFVYMMIKHVNNIYFYFLICYICELYFIFVTQGAYQISL